MTSEPVDSVAPEQTEPRDQALAIGERLAEHRTRRGVKVSALARQIGVSPSLISQIERGQSRPSVSTLFALAEALDVPVDVFFRNGEAAPPSAPRELVAPREGQRQDRYAVRHHQRAGIDIEGGVRWERLTPAPLDDVEFMELIYAPGAESNSALYRHPGFEMVLVFERPAGHLRRVRALRARPRRQHGVPVDASAPLREPGRGDRARGHHDPARRAAREARGRVPPPMNLK